MTKQEILKEAHDQLIQYSREFTPKTNAIFPATVYQKDWLIIEDRRPDLTESEASQFDTCLQGDIWDRRPDLIKSEASQFLGYKYKILIKGLPYHIPFATSFESLMDFLNEYNNL